VVHDPGIFLSRLGETRQQIASSRRGGSMKKLLTGGNFAVSGYSASARAGVTQRAKHGYQVAVAMLYRAQSPNAAIAASLAVSSGVRRCANPSGQSASRGRTACNA